MPTAPELYAQYRLPPTLQTHQLRVAGVAYQICQSLPESAQAELSIPNIVSTCLLHDMGNIIKFDLTAFPDLLEPEGREYWSQVQADFVRRYGVDEHLAALAIAQEIGVSDEVLALMKCVGFHHTQANLESGDLHRMIPSYADDRVTPWGVVTLEQRIADLERRYGHKYPSPADHDRRQNFADWARKIETAIFAQSSLQPEAVVDETVEALFPLLQQFIIS